MSRLRGFIGTYIDAKFDAFNSSLSIPMQIKRIASEIDMTKITAKESNINYQLFIDSEQNGRMDSVKVSIDFIFGIGGKNADIYEKVIDTYLWDFRRLFRQGRLPHLPLKDSESSLCINAVENVSMITKDRIEGVYFKPSIELTLTVSDD